jgi:hypothetical protein
MLAEMASGYIESANRQKSSKYANFAMSSDCGQIVLDTTCCM